MARPHRNADGLLRGTLDYGQGNRLSIVEHVLPVVLPCMNCKSLTYHVLGSEHAGLGFSIPFVGTLASTHKRYGFVCNDCTVISGVNGGSRMLQSLEARVLPAEVCDRIDRFLAAIPGAPLAYSPGFAKFVISVEEKKPEDLAWLTGYRRFDSRRIT